MYKYINGNTHNFSFHTKGTHIHLIFQFCLFTRQQITVHPFFLHPCCLLLIAEVEYSKESSPFIFPQYTQDTVVMYIICIHICIFIKCYLLSADLFQPVKCLEYVSLNRCDIFLILSEFPR